MSQIRACIRYNDDSVSNLPNLQQPNPAPIQPNHGLKWNRKINNIFLYYQKVGHYLFYLIYVSNYKIGGLSRGLCCLPWAVVWCFCWQMNVKKNSSDYLFFNFSNYYIHTCRNSIYASDYFFSFQLQNSGTREWLQSLTFSLMNSQKWVRCMP